jgi:hypothetical protein
MQANKNQRFIYFRMLKNLRGRMYAKKNKTKFSVDQEFYIGMNLRMRSVGCVKKKKQVFNTILSLTLNKSET